MCLVAFKEQSWVFSCHLNTWLLIWVFEEADYEGFSWLFCLFGGFIHLFPRDWAFVSTGRHKIDDCIVWWKWKGKILFSSSTLPGIGCGPRLGNDQCQNGHMAGAHGHCNIIAHLSPRQKTNEVAISFIQMALKKQHFMHWFDFQELESNYGCFVRSLTSVWKETSFSPATVTNSWRYKIKITYFVINILIY